MSAPSHTKRSADTTFRRFALAGLLVALWIATRPYYGIINDARLYTVMALHGLHPERFAQEVFFRFGSQDSFTLFSRLYEEVVAIFGIATAHLIVLVIGQAIWLWALSRLMRAIFGDGKEFWLATTCAIALQSVYGGFGVIHYGEPFVTSRLFSEALGLLAIAFAIDRRFFVSAAIAAAAMMLHPLMALAPVSVLVLLLTFQDRRWWLAIGAGAIVATTLAVAGVEPFTRILTRFDDAWFSVIYRESDYSFLSEWDWNDALKTATAIALLALASLSASGTQRKFFLAVGTVAVGGLLASFVGGDLGHNLLLVDLQAWRCMWLATLIANAVVGALIERLPVAWCSREALAEAAILNFLSGYNGVFGLFAPIFMAFACALTFAEMSRKAALPTGFRRIGRAIFLATVIILIYSLTKARPSVQAITLRDFSGVILATATLGLLLIGIYRSGFHLLVPSVTVLVLAILSADQRDAWQKYVEAPEPDKGLKAFLAGAGNVYWEGQPGNELLWLKLQRPSFYSCVQGAGAMFYRGTAEEFARRGNILRELNTRDFAEPDRIICAMKSHPGVWGPRSRVQLASACRALPDLDAMVLVTDIPGAKRGIWHSPVPATYFEQSRNAKFDRFYRYDCDSLRGS